MTQAMKTQESTATVMNRIAETEFEEGEVYLFHPSDAECPAESSLWGIFGNRSRTQVFLESSAAADLEHFVLSGLLPIDYRYCRLASRAEMRDYVYALACCERRRHQR